MKLKWLIRSQSIATLAAGMIYPYYLLFLKNLGSTYSAYGLAFAAFTVSSAAASLWLGKRMDHSGVRFVAAGSFGMMAAMLAFPWIASYSAVLLVQAGMGICNAMQKMGERQLIADGTEEGRRGPDIGSYHFWTSVSSGFAVLIGGYMIDLLTIDVLFYASAALYGWSGGLAWLMSRRRQTT